MKIFRIDKEQNPLEIDVEFDVPIVSSSYLPRSNELVVGGRRQYFYAYNLDSGALRTYHGKA